jgi:hypothetical protein
VNSAKSVKFYKNKILAVDQPMNDNNNAALFDLDKAVQDSISGIISCDWRYCRYGNKWKGMLIAKAASSRFSERLCFSLLDSRIKGMVKAKRVHSMENSEGNGSGRWLFKLPRIRSIKGTGEQWKKVLPRRSSSMHCRFKKGGSKN